LLLESISLASFPVVVSLGSIFSLSCVAGASCSGVAFPGTSFLGVSSLLASVEPCVSLETPCCELSCSGLVIVLSSTFSCCGVLPLCGVLSPSVSAISASSVVSCFFFFLSF